MADLQKITQDWHRWLAENPDELEKYIAGEVEKRVSRAIRQYEQDLAYLHKTGPYDLDLTRGDDGRWQGLLRAFFCDEHLVLPHAQAIVLARLALHIFRDRSDRDVAPYLDGHRLRTDDLRVPDFDPMPLASDAIEWEERQARKHVKALRNQLNALRVIEEPIGQFSDRQRGTVEPGRDRPQNAAFSYPASRMLDSRPVQRVAVRLEVRSEVRAHPSTAVVLGYHIGQPGALVEPEPVAFDGGSHGWAAAGASRLPGGVSLSQGGLPTGPWGSGYPDPWVLRPLCFAQVDALSDVSAGTYTWSG